MSRRVRPAPRRGPILALLLALLAGCGRGSPPDVVIVVTDTLRRDRVDAFGGGRGLMPALDAFARRATVFPNAYSTSAWTSPAVASLFTSRHPSEHGIERFESVLGQGEETLAEVLAARGYACGGFSANWLIRSALGYGQGFEQFQTQRSRGAGFDAASERALDTVRRALAWLDARPESPSQPIFLYLQLMDPHMPYRPTRRALRRVFGDDPLPDLERANEAVWAREPLPPAMRAVVERLYDAEASSLDGALGLFLTALDRTGRLRRSLVIVLADHGQALWEHGLHGHGQSLYDELIHIPLVVQVPGQTRGRRVATPVSLVDVAPTVLEAVGAPRPAAFRGRSFWPQVLGEPGPSPAEVAQVSELIDPPPVRRGPGHERAVVLGDAKLIVDVDGTRHYLDRAADPDEQGGASLSQPQRRALDRALEHFVAGLGDRSAPEHAPLDAETRRELRALGYLE